MQHGAINASVDMASLSPSSLNIMKLSDYHGVNTTTTTTASTMTASLSTPSMCSRIETMCDAKDCMKLTPVNLRCLASPIRQSSQISNDDFNTNKGLVVDDVYKENFGLISRQLEKLLENLNVIFKKIGYSNLEIISKEKVIFNTLSDSITKFFEQSETDMKSLTADNKFTQEILNRILELINDISGIESIPDLYIRNAILIPQSKTVPSSPKKPLSLLSKKRLLTSAKGFVYDAYIPKLLNYLNACVQAQLMYNTINETLPNLPNDKIFSSLPSLEVSKLYRDTLRSFKNDSDSISKFIRENKDDLLFSEHFNDISNEMTLKINQSAKIYQGEYKSRLKRLTTVGKAISEILVELQMDLNNDLDPQIRELISLYSQIEDINRPNKNVSVHRSIIERLEKVYNDYKLVHKKRNDNKEEVLAKCQVLWAKLKVPQNYIDNFLSQNSGLSLASLKKVCDELDKLETMKKKLIKTLINDSWQRIEELWMVLQYADPEKSHFIYMFESMKESSTSLEDDEKVLEICEEEVKNLEKKLAVYRPILQLIVEFKLLQADKLSLDESSKDSSRLLLRNSHKILLQEEKTRKKITRHFPRVIQELKDGLLEIEELFGKPLVLNGQKLAEVVAQQEEELISKYPRSRLNLGVQKRANSGSRVLSGMVEKKPLKQGKYKRNATMPSRMGSDHTTVHQTPITKINKCSPEKIQLNSLDSNTSFIFNTHEARFSSPPKSLTTLLPPTVITRKAQSRIPEPRMRRSNSSNLSSSPVFKARPSKINDDILRPTRLFPVSPNKINQRRTQIPMLAKSASLLSDQVVEVTEKENIVDSTPKLTHTSQKNEMPNFSSPYREPNNSVYKISMSPEGRCTLAIQEKEDESGLDDGSFMDDENDKDFLSWKKEQLQKLKEQSKDIQN